MSNLFYGETIVYQEKQSRPIAREKPRDFCKLGHDEVTLMIDGNFWYTIAAPRLMNFIHEIVPSTARKEAYTKPACHGIFAFLTVNEAYELHDRMELEGGHCAFLRKRGLLV